LIKKKSKILRFNRMTNEEATFTFNKNLVKKKIKQMLIKNPQLNKSSVDTFSRQVPSFYTALCVEIYGKYENSGPLFNKAMNLFRKISVDKDFVNEIKNLDPNSESDTDLPEIDEEPVDFKLIHFSKNERIEKKSKGKIDEYEVINNIN
jgi:hypothetical protein